MGRSQLELAAHTAEDHNLVAASRILGAVAAHRTAELHNLYAAAGRTDCSVRLHRLPAAGDSLLAAGTLQVVVCHILVEDILAPRRAVGIQGRHRQHSALRGGLAVARRHEQALLLAAGNPMQQAAGTHQPLAEARSSEGCWEADTKTADGQQRLRLHSRWRSTACNTLRSHRTRRTGLEKVLQAVAGSYLGHVGVRARLAAAGRSCTAPLPQLQLRSGPAVLVLAAVLLAAAGRKATLAHRTVHPRCSSSRTAHTRKVRTLLVVGTW